MMKTDFYTLWYDVMDKETCKNGMIQNVLE